MCGICGICGPSSQRPDNEIVVQAMMDTLVHRGPDESGMLRGESFIFGHRRLSVIDLDSGFQPMQSEDGRINLVYNGEIYNYLELRQSLVQKGVRFKTFSDTEVLLRLYQLEGLDCISKLNGMFAFAVYDHGREIFFAARDHFGIKPFYYSRLKDGSIVFASEIKALLKFPDIVGELDNDSFNQYLTFQFCLKDRTLFKGIKKLEPGQMMTIKSSGGYSRPRLAKYWDVSYHVDNHHTEDYFADKLLLLLQDSVRNQLRSDVPVGAYLSGGLDSSAVVNPCGQPGSKRI